MRSLFVNIHTHHYKENTAEEFSLPNIIVSKNYLIPQPCTLGIHPWYVDRNYEAQFDVLHQYGKQQNILAIGECGLDKLCDTEFHIQEHVFRKQIVIANCLNKPLIIHCVRAYQECIRILREEKVAVPVLFHGFDKKIELAEQLLGEGYYLSLGASLLTTKKDDLITGIPLDRIFLETDDKSSKIVDIYTYFCRVQKIDLNLLKEQVYKNFVDIFNYPLGR
ncbi:TatD family deoxyribonuclease [Sphingobacterium psychroaquaticum]|uniref:TatD family hydrolase n=1 Tax=Sphingobacterium psychroaquaticum TaxID=561061 RepID=UPI00106B43A2|nr:TatD family hydrolase [Sphingobacterium psychroaquaticum]QBQ41469.1 TatD family deoxyribonuclease [Sphingobacterium psychroaquaticum]